MAVFREMVIAWKGKDYTLVPSMRLMRTIEMGDISFTDIAIRTSRGRPPISHIAFVLAKMLQSAGASVSEEEVYEELMTGGQDNATALIGAVLSAFSPSEGKAKNPDAQSVDHPTPRAT
jgi:hypothetical protein